MLGVLHCKSSSLGFFRKLSSSSLAAAVAAGVVVGAVSTEEQRVWPAGKRPHMFNTPSDTLRLELIWFSLLLYAGLTSILAQALDCHVKF